MSSLRSYLYIKRKGILFVSFLLKSKNIHDFLKKIFYVDFAFLKSYLYNLVSHSILNYVSRFKHFVFCIRDFEMETWRLLRSSILSMAPLRICSNATGEHPPQALKSGAAEQLTPQPQGVTKA